MISELIWLILFIFGIISIIVLSIMALAILIEAATDARDLYDVHRKE